MHYSYEVTVTASDTIDDPVILPITLGAGIITDAQFLFDIGDGFSTCVCLWTNYHQLLPTNPDGFYSADGLMIPAKLWHSLEKEGNVLYIVAWNRGGLYDHTVNVMLDVRGPEEPDIHELALRQIEVTHRLIDLMKAAF